MSFGVGVITPRWLYVLAVATPADFGTPILTDETLDAMDPTTIQPGDVVGIGIHSGNALRGVRSRHYGPSCGRVGDFGGIHATLYPDEARELGGAHAVVRGDGERAWPAALADCAGGVLLPPYEGGRIEPTEFRAARWDLLPPKRYMWASVGAVSEGLRAAPDDVGRRNPRAHAAHVGSLLQPAPDLDPIAVRAHAETRLAFVLISKIDRQMHANTGLATDSARVGRSARWARWMAKPCPRLFSGRPMPHLRLAAIEPVVDTPATVRVIRATPHVTSERDRIPGQARRGPLIAVTDCLQVGDVGSSRPITRISLWTFLTMRSRLPESSWSGSSGARHRAGGPFVAAAVCAVVLHAASLASAQSTPESPAASEQHQHAMAQDAAALFPAREASGTAWLPDDTPMFGVQRTWRAWQIMLHGNAFGQFLYEPGDRHRTGGFSNRQVSSVNWGMLMARRPLGTGRVGLRAMASVEPWTVADCGFLNLLASGEMCQGDTIHDRQHPHDLVMELAGEYDRPVRGSLRWQVYAGLSGEPALGPAGFPHRLSAMPNPIAPVTHHWLDSSHITFGLITTGLYDKRWKAEMSVFNGREPDDNRANVDLAALDSVSGRLSFMPTARLALQVSTAHLHEAEAEFRPRPRSDVNRTTASATYHRQLDRNRFWATTLAYGVNSGPEVLPAEVVHLVTHAALLESSLTLRERHTWFGRFEVVGKPAHDLHAHEYTSRIFGVAKLEAGYVRHFKAWHALVPGIGGVVSANFLPPELAPRYSGRVAPGFGVFVTVRPMRHMM